MPNKKIKEIKTTLKINNNLNQTASNSQDISR